MQSYEIIIIFFLIENLIIIGFNIKSILRLISPQDFFIIQIFSKIGEIKQNIIFKSKIKEGKIKINNNEYYINPSHYFFKNSKFLQFQEGNKFSIENQQNLKNNLEILYQDLKVEGWKLFTIPSKPLEDLLKLLLPAIVGAVLGALIMTVHWQSKCQIIGG